MALGIATLLGQVPLDLALMHQAGAAVVFVLAVVHLHAVRRTPPTRDAAAIVDRASA
jgi:cytochrome c oxidase assembly protein subunit 15